MNKHNAIYLGIPPKTHNLCQIVQVFNYNTPWLFNQLVICNAKFAVPITFVSIKLTR